MIDSMTSRKGGIIYCANVLHSLDMIMRSIKHQQIISCHVEGAATLCIVFEKSIDIPKLLGVAKRLVRG